MFNWLRNSRRRRIASEPWPAEWDEFLHGRADFLEAYSPLEKEQWKEIVKVLVAEKSWEGVGGLAMSPEVQVVIAAHAARLTIALPEKFFDRVQTVIVRPEQYRTKMTVPIGSNLALEGDERDVLGQAWHRGPVVLSWADVLDAAEGEAPGENVVLHEFAHQLDMRNGPADGVPDFDSAKMAERWEKDLKQQFEWFLTACSRGVETVVDPGGTENLAEFFAYSTEVFFELPAELQDQMPGLYVMLRSFYGQDPAKTGDA
jgi:Mlc titration factor MtfA (ptsG expression regulator)